MRLSNETRTAVRNQIEQFRKYAVHYSRIAIAARWKHARAKYEAEAAKFDARVRALTLALELGGAR